MFINEKDVIDIKAPTEPGSLMRGCQIDASGLFRVSRRTCELHSVKVLHSGSCGLIEAVTGTGRSLFRMPSAFTGSFALNIESEGGLILKLHSGIPASVQISWREPDAKVL